MSGDIERATNERTHLLQHVPADRRLSVLRHAGEASSIISSAVSKEEAALGSSTVGERLPYNDYATIDFLHDLVKDSYRRRTFYDKDGLRNRFFRAFDASSGWIAVAIIGTLTACVAFVVDVSVVTLSDWKFGYCTTNPFWPRKICCPQSPPGSMCPEFHQWGSSFWSKYGIYFAVVLLYGLVSSSVTMLTKGSLPATEPVEANGNAGVFENHGKKILPQGKTLYMAAGSGIPEIKTILSGFVINNYLDAKVLIVKAIGACFAVSTGMCLGKEGPFVHIATCVGHIIATRFPRYRDNQRKLREMLSASCAAGLTVAFGAPIGGVLFAYEEISTYFPRKVLWRAFLCSLFAAIVLKHLNPHGKLALFETDYGTSYLPVHYVVFVLLGIAGGIFGGLFCKLNYRWSKWFRGYSIIKQHPVFETLLICAATAIIQYPNPIAREVGDVIIEDLLIDCKGGEAVQSFVCRNEADPASFVRYMGWLVYGTLAKLVLTIITFGIKVPAGVIIPALDGGAFFGRLVGQWAGTATISPGIFAMVGASAFLAGVSRMTISLAVIMFELTGELEYIVPDMIGILVAKWVADSISKEGVYDLAQTVLGHPFIDLDHATMVVQRLKVPHLVEALIPPKETMDEITVVVPPSNKVPRKLLEDKLQLLRRRGLLDAGLVLVQSPPSQTNIATAGGALSRSRGILQGYISEPELQFGLSNTSFAPRRRESRAPYYARDSHDGIDSTHHGAADELVPGLGSLYPEDTQVRLLGTAEEDEFDLSMFVDRTPPVVNASAPLEYAVEMFGRLGLRYMCVLEEGTGGLVGVIIKKRLVALIEKLEHES